MNVLLQLLLLLHKETVSRPVDYDGKGNEKPRPEVFCIICGASAPNKTEVKHRSECPWSLLPPGLLEV